MVRTDRIISYKYMKMKDLWVELVQQSNHIAFNQASLGQPSWQPERIMRTTILCLGRFNE